MTNNKFTASLLLKTSPQKTRLVIDLVRGKTLEEAFDILKTVNKGASIQIFKLLKSAASNINTKEEDYSKVFVQTIQAEEAQRLYRSMPRARGSAFKIRRRYSRVKVKLSVS